MPTVEKAPSDPWPRAARGLDIVLLPGSRPHQAANFSAATGMTIRVPGGTQMGDVVIEGDVNPGGTPCLMRFNDGCHRLRILGPIEGRGSSGRGIWITVADDIELRDLFLHHMGIEGVLTGSCRRAVYERITVEDSQPSSTGADRRHGLYVSGNADGARVTGLTVRRVTGSGLQFNGAGMNATIEGASASELVFERCGSGGTCPISCMALRNSVIEKFNIDWSARQGYWGVCFDDGKGSNYNCRNVTFRTYSVPPGTRCSIEAGSSNITQEPGAGWQPGPTPPEPPEPPQPPDTEPDIDAAKAAIRDAQAQLEKALAALG